MLPILKKRWDSRSSPHRLEEVMSVTPQFSPPNGRAETERPLAGAFLSRRDVVRWFSPRCVQPFGDKMQPRRWIGEA